MRTTSALGSLCFAVSSLSLLALPACAHTGEPEAENETRENVSSQESELVATDPVSAAITASCSTGSVRGLATQLVDQIQCMKPGTLSKIDNLANTTLGSDVFPYLQTPTRTALVAAIAARGSRMTINSALRVLPEQYILYRWYQTGRCNIQLAASPGNSNHESGLAVDVQDNVGWRSAMQGNGFRWFGPNDVVHYDYVGAGAVDMKGLSVLAFQKLWNRNHPEDLLTEDSSYGPTTESRLARSPVGGFAKGASCKDPDAGVASDDAASAPAAEDSGTALPPTPTASPAQTDAASDLPADEPSGDAGGCTLQPSTQRSSREPREGAWLVALGAALACSRRNRRAPREKASVRCE